MVARGGTKANLIGNRVLLAKTCPKCMIFKQADEFVFDRRGHYLSWCTPCKNKASVESISRTNQAVLAAGGFVNHNKTWLYSEILAMKKLLLGGMKEKEIAPLLGRSYKAVHRMSDRYKDADLNELIRLSEMHAGERPESRPVKETGVRWTTDEDELLLMLTAKGLLEIEVADILGRSQKSVKARKARIKMIDERQKSRAKWARTKEILGESAEVKPSPPPKPVVVKKTYAPVAQVSTAPKTAGCDYCSGLDMKAECVCSDTLMCRDEYCTYYYRKASVI